MTLESGSIRPDPNGDELARLLWQDLVQEKADDCDRIAAWAKREGYTIVYYWLDSAARELRRLVT